MTDRTSELVVPGVGHMKRLVVVVGVLSFLFAAACTTPPIVRPPNPPGAPDLTVTPVVTGLVQPWDLAFTPDGTMLFNEKVGRIDAWIGGAKRVLAQPADVVVALEGGLLGLAVDPAFASNRRIYTCMLSNISGSLDVRLVRWQVNAGYTALTNRTDILTGLPVNKTGEAGRHSGCRPRFGPDGYLWVTAGDSATSTVPQNPQSLGGKVLRVTTDGAGAPGNPRGALRPEIYTLGQRNPQGVSFRSNGQAYSIEHGTDCDDEINKLVPGGNYGWNPVPLGGGSAYDESRPMTDLSIPGAIPAVWSSGCPTIAPSGATFLSGSQWKAWNGAFAAAVLKANELFVAQLDGTGNSVAQIWTAITDRGRLRTRRRGSRRQPLHRHRRQPRLDPPGRPVVILSS